MDQPKCLHCGADLPGSEGIVTCEKCGATLMFDFDGQIQMAEAPSQEILKAEEMLQAPVQEGLGFEAPLLSPPEVNEIESVEPKNLTNLQSEDEFADIVQFANQESSSGALHYEIKISSIDTKETRSELMRRIGQARLGLSVKSLEGMIVRGELSLPKLSAAQASLVMGLLRDLNLKTSWRQSVYES